MSTEETPQFLRKLAVPRPSSGHLAALGETDRPIAVFSDFDGTIFLQDTGHVLFDKFGCGAERRSEIDASIGKTRSFREASEELWGSLDVTLPDAIAELKSQLVIDPDFIHLFDYLQDHNVQFTVISAGVKPLLKSALEAFVGLERSAKINIIANNAEITPQGKWTAKWLHDSPLGIDKSIAIKDWIAQYDTSKSPVPKIVFTGDGVSDLAAARQADILFARQGLALETYCIEHMIPYIPYMRFKEVLHDVQYLIKGNRYHDKAAAESARRMRLEMLTGGLGPLSASKPKPSFGLGSDEEDESDDDEEGDGDDDGDDDKRSVKSSKSTRSVGSVRSLSGSRTPDVPHRPHTPPNEPSFHHSRSLLVHEFTAGEADGAPVAETASLKLT